MAWLIRWQNKKKDGTRSWRVAWEFYDLNGTRRSKYLPKEKWGEVGLRPAMSYAQAQKTVKALNQDIRIKKEDEKRQKIAARLESESLETVRYIPPDLDHGFRLELKDHPDPKRMESLWRAARKLMKEVKIPPEEWKRRSQAIYNYFEKNRLSPDYAKKIIRLMNLWGEFYSVKTSKPYSRLPSPKGHARSRIQIAYRKSCVKDKASDGLTPEELAQAKKTMLPEHYQWLFVSLWFGLRPNEVDNLIKGDEFSYFSWNEEYEVDSLWVNQTKLRNLSEEERWKEIPVLYPQQIKAIEYITQGKLKNPWPKTIKLHTDGNHHRYAGRKGFSHLMWDKGHDLVEVSSWMGHKSIDRTYRDYMKWKKLKLRRKSVIKK